MVSQNGKRTAKIKFGEFFVTEFFKNEDKVFGVEELEKAAVELGINPTKVKDIILLEFAGVIVTDGDGHFSLNEDYLAGDFLVHVNTQRQERRLEPLERPKPNRGERLAS